MLPNDKILEWSKLKDFDDDKINETYKFVSERTENIFGKGESWSPAFSSFPNFKLSPLIVENEDLFWFLQNEMFTWLVFPILLHIGVVWFLKTLLTRFLSNFQDSYRRSPSRSAGDRYILDKSITVKIASLQYLYSNQHPFSISKHECTWTCSTQWMVKGLCFLSK